MRFIQATHTYPPEIGGSQAVVKALADGLIARGHQVTVFAGRGSAKQPTETFENGVRIIRWPTWSFGNAYFMPKSRGEFVERLGGLIEEADILHIHNIQALFASSAWTAWKNRKNQGCKLVVTPYYHGGGHTVLRSLLWRFWRRRARAILSCADAVHTVSKSEANLILKDFQVRCIPVENGVEPNLLDLAWNPSGYVIYAGRLEKYKNVERLANIVKLLNKEHSLGLRLLIVGEGPYEEQLKSYLDDLKTEFELKHFQSYDTYLSLIGGASVMALLSEKESYPQSINEANAIGVPVVVAEPWGPNYSTRSRTLVVSMEEDDERIAAKMYPYLADVGNEPKSKVPTWAEVVDDYVRKVYEPCFQARHLVTQVSSRVPTQGARGDLGGAGTILGAVGNPTPAKPSQG
jgi:1,2-diacylglycerol 3-alpha-glucosyltransferase